MSGSEHARPVWLTEDDLEWDGREDDETNLWRIYQTVCAKRAAAPADPAEAVREAVSTALRTGKSSTAAVLRALGKPDA